MFPLGHEVVDGSRHDIAARHEQQGAGMNTEEIIGHVLEREAEKHRVNQTLPPAVVTKARLLRSVMVAGMGALVLSVAVGGYGLARNFDGSQPQIAPGSDPSSEAQDPSPTDGSPSPYVSESGSLSGNPLLLITQEGWRVTRADQYGAEEGEMTFTDGNHRLDLFWRPKHLHDQYVQDRATSAASSWELTIAGHEAVLIQYEGTTDFTAQWLDGDFSLELRGVFPDVDEYRAVATTLQFVDERTWLAAMPESVVVPDDRDATVESMLADIPVHASVRVEELKSEGLVNDRYQLGARVTGAVACAWIEQWVDAKAKGDDASAQEASDAMATSRTWSMLIEMKDQGGWSQVVWQYADAMVGNGQIPAGRPMTLVEGYGDGLGCGRFE
jgi:hypothetical protein